MSSRTARSRDRLYAMSRCLIIVGVAMAEGWPDCHMALAQDGAPRFMSLPQPPYSDDWQGAYDDPPSEQGYCPPNSNCPPLLQNIEEARHVAIYGVLGLGTPVGSTGLELVIRPWRLLEVSGGLGLGVSVHNSVQLSFAKTPSGSPFGPTVTSLASPALPPSLRHYPRLPTWSIFT